MVRPAQPASLFCKHGVDGCQNPFDRRTNPSCIGVDYKSVSSFYEGTPVGVRLSNPSYPGMLENCMEKMPENYPAASKFGWRVGCGMRDAELSCSAYCREPSLGSMCLLPFAVSSSIHWGYTTKGRATAAGYYNLMTYYNPSTSWTRQCSSGNYECPPNNNDPFCQSCHTPSEHDVLTACMQGCLHISDLTFNPTKNPTANPTTDNPTMNPTTVNPTANPTTLNPTTSNPTTANPTTVNPTTGNPTMNPTTDNPTLGPTTLNPTTVNPTTGSPSTANPTTDNPTMSPTTINPTTANPTPDSATTIPTITPFPTPEPNSAPTSSSSSSSSPGLQSGESSNAGANLAIVAVCVCLFVGMLIFFWWRWKRKRMPFSKYASTSKVSPSKKEEYAPTTSHEKALGSLPLVEASINYESPDKFRVVLPKPKATQIRILPAGQEITPRKPLGKLPPLIPRRSRAKK